MRESEEGGGGGDAVIKVQRQANSGHYRGAAIYGDFTDQRMVVVVGGGYGVDRT